MSIQQQLIVTACVVYFGLISVQPLNQVAAQVVTDEVNGENQIQENYYNMFDLIAKNTTQNNEMYHKILQQEMAKERKAFHTMKEELQVAQIKNSYKKQNFNKKSGISSENFKPFKRQASEAQELIERFKVLSDQKVGSDAFQGFNPFNKSRYELPWVKVEDRLNETYYSGLEAALELWWRERYYIDRTIVIRDNITLQMGQVEIQPFDEQVNRTEELIHDEIFILQDIAWGKRKEVRDPLDKTMVRKLSYQWKTLQACLDEENLPPAIKKADEWVKKDIDLIRSILKRALEDLATLYANIGKAIEEVESGNKGKMKPLKWIQKH